MVQDRASIRPLSVVQSGAVPLMTHRRDPEAKAKQQILAGLSDALAALSGRMNAQQDAAVRITLLAVRAETIAERSWNLSQAGGQRFDDECEALAKDISAFATEVSSAAKRAGEEALLGREVARAITAHAEDIAKLAREIDHLPDASAVRARLRPLSNTLTELPQRLKAGAATIKEVNGISALARGLAERGDVLAAGGVAASRAAMALSGDLRRFAEEATAISLEMTRGSAAAVKAIDEMAGTTVALSRGQPPPGSQESAIDRMAAPGRDAALSGEVWCRPAAAPKDPPIASSKAWGAATVRSR
jgi:hypothetical protein